MDTAFEEGSRHLEKTPRPEVQSELEAALASLESGWDFVDQVKEGAIVEVHRFMDGVSPAIVALAGRAEEDIRAATARTEQQIRALDHEPGDGVHEKERVRAEVISLITELQNQDWYVTDEMVKRAEDLVQRYGDRGQIGEAAIHLYEIIKGSYSPTERLGGVRTLLHEHAEYAPDIALHLSDAAPDVSAEATPTPEMHESIDEAVSAVSEAHAEDDVSDGMHSFETVLEGDRVLWDERRASLQKYVTLLEDPSRPKADRVADRQQVAVAKKGIALYEAMLAAAPLETEIRKLTDRLLVFHPTTPEEREEQRAMHDRVEELRLKRKEAQAQVQKISAELKEAKARGELTVEDVLATSQDGVVRKAPKDLKPAKDLVSPPTGEASRRREKQAREEAETQLASVMQEFERARDGGDPARIDMCYVNAMNAYSGLIKAYESSKDLTMNERLDLGVIRCDKQIAHHDHQAYLLKQERDAATDPKVREEKEEAWMKELDAKHRFTLVKSQLLYKKAAKPEREEGAGAVTGKVISPMDMIISLVGAVHDPGAWVEKVSGGFLEGNKTAEH